MHRQPHNTYTTCEIPGVHPLPRPSPFTGGSAARAASTCLVRKTDIMGCIPMHRKEANRGR